MESLYLYRISKKRKMVRKKKNYETSRHHIWPKSRGGTARPSNISRIDSEKHKYYHAMFSNQTPPEIIETLVKDYWNGNWDYVRDAYYGRDNSERENHLKSLEELARKI